jgi:hypothetical protein
MSSDCYIFVMTLCLTRDLFNRVALQNICIQISTSKHGQHWFLVASMPLIPCGQISLLPMYYNWKMVPLSSSSSSIIWTCPWFKKNTGPEPRLSSLSKRIGEKLVLVTSLTHWINSPVCGFRTSTNNLLKTRMYRSNGSGRSWIHVSRNEWNKQTDMNSRCFPENQFVSSHSPKFVNIHGELCSE